MSSLLQCSSKLTLTTIRMNRMIKQIYYKSPALSSSNLTNFKRNLVNKSLYEDEMLIGFEAGVESNPMFIEGKMFTNNRLEYGAKRFYRGKIKAAIFDWGGTVVDCGVCAPILTYVELFKDENVEITEDEARAPLGTSSLVHIGKILEKEAVYKRWLKAKNGQPPTEDDVKRMWNKFVPTILSSFQKYSNVIEGVSDTVKLLRSAPFNLKIGSTTGYPSNVLSVLLNASQSQGFIPDASVCLSDVPPSKPSPFMLWTCATRLSIFPIEAIVKVDDSINGIHEGLLAGCWAVGIAKTSSYVGLTEQQLEEVGSEELTRKMNRAYKHLINSGAHYVIDTIKDLPLVINDINRRLASGEKP